MIDKFLVPVNNLIRDDKLGANFLDNQMNFSKTDSRINTGFE